MDLLEKPSHRSALAAWLAVAPALLMLILFYSLALHMHHSLGAWPTSIGERGFPAPLITHGAIAGNYFSTLALVTIFGWPIAFLACSFIRRWRKVIYYLGLYALSCVLSFGVMLLAPSPFLNWWWD